MASDISLWVCICSDREQAEQRKVWDTTHLIHIHIRNSYRLLPLQISTAQTPRPNSIPIPILLFNI